ncbi:MAG: T9SS C-terminal target domain-containing protein [Ignavibacteriales bacterium]|nr:MAG: T9SS C-terminal target domain-containing protein [Ignavibacteriales bacterium]
MKRLLLFVFVFFVFSQVEFAATTTASLDTVVFFDGAGGPWYEWYDFWGGSLPVVGQDTCKYNHSGSGQSAGKNSIKWVMDSTQCGFAWSWWSNWNIFDFTDIFANGYLDMWLKVPSGVDSLVLEFKSNFSDNERMQYYLTPANAIFNNTWQEYKIPFSSWTSPVPPYTGNINSTYVTLFGIFSWKGERGKVIYIGNTTVYPTSANLPVELTSFTVSKNNDLINLCWSTATETNNKGFEIERKTDSGSWNLIGYKNGKGNAAEKTNYTFTDNISKMNAQSFTYRLKQIDFDGSFVYSSEVNVKNSAPLKFALEQNYPNPFNPNTTIKFQLAKDNFINLNVYNSLGEEVASLVNEYKTAGTYEVNFDASGLTSGIYYTVLRNTDSKETLITKMLLMK